jgi:hypothetical protein
MVCGWALPSLPRTMLDAVFAGSIVVLSSALADP